MRALFIVFAALGACAAPQDASTPADGKAFTLHCNQSELRWDACYQKAARVCGERGYQIVSDGSGGVPATATNVYEVPVIGGEMVIRCNP